LGLGFSLFIVKPRERLKALWPVIDTALKTGMFIELCTFLELCMRYQGLFAWFPGMIFPGIDPLENGSVGMGIGTGRDGDLMAGPLSCIVEECLRVLTWFIGLLASIECFLGLSREENFLFTNFWKPLAAKG
jgi:hypothetical protein